MNKPICEAIVADHPLRWEMDPDSAMGCMRLLATTFVYENGNTRQRTLYRTFSPVGAARLTREIVEAGGRMAGPDPQELHARWQESQT